MTAWNPKIKRIFHHYELWEEFHAGMWRGVPVEENQGFVDAAAALMKDVDGFLSAMMTAMKEWKYSCEANLTSQSTNRRAWCGHAGCCIATKSPEHLTRLAWHTLTQPQQDLANAAADKAIAAWEREHLRKLQEGGLCPKNTSAQMSLWPQENG